MRIILTSFALACWSFNAGFAADAKAGQSTFDKSCRSCHGADGTPNPAIAKMMQVDMKDLKSADVQAMSNDDLKKIISDGKGKMKPVRTVTGGDADSVIAYIRSLKK